MGDAGPYPQGVEGVADQRDREEADAAGCLVVAVAMAAKGEAAVRDIADRHRRHIADTVRDLGMQADRRGQGPVDRGLAGGDEQAGYAVTDDLPEQGLLLR